jgi:hypothetical protein
MSTIVGVYRELYLSSISSSVTRHDAISTEEEENETTDLQCNIHSDDVTVLLGVAELKKTTNLF